MSAGSVSGDTSSEQPVGLSRGEIQRVVNRYIGVHGGYLGDFTYRSLADLYPEYCDLDLSPWDYSGDCAVINGANHGWRTGPEGCTKSTIGIGVRRHGARDARRDRADGGRGRGLTRTIVVRRLLR